MTLGVLTTVHGRRKLTRLLARYYATLDLSYDLVGVAVASREDTWALDEMDGWLVILYDNLPLSDKWLEGIHHLEGLVDGVLIVGSDDFCDLAFMEEAVLALRTSPYVMPRGLHFYEPSTGRALYREFVRCGAGRLLRADLLDGLDWQPWRAGSGAPDAAMNRMVEPAIGGLDKAARVGGVVLDVKTGDNMWPYDHLVKGDYEEVDGMHLLRNKFPTIADELLHF